MAKDPGTLVDDIDLTKTMSKEESDKRVTKAQHRLTQLRLFSAGLLEPAAPGPALIVLFEGFDAAGKGGTIRRLTASLDPRHVLVHPVGPPTEEEQRHHFLWRFQPFIPGTGEMTVFDRSWYGRLLVERVEGEISDEVAERSAKEIVEFERMLSDDHTTIVKFWLHISEKEQLRRFEERRRIHYKAWKLTEDDWRTREKWSAYEDAVEEMLLKTSTRACPWNLIEGNDKYWARVRTLTRLVEALSEELGYKPADPLKKKASPKS